MLEKFIKLKAFADRRGSGGGPNILDKNGIIKQEYLPEGFPYKSGVDDAVILPTVTLEPIPDMDGQMAIADVLEILVGEEYTVNWNGTEYKTKCVMPNVSGEEAEFYAGALGNVGLLGGEMTEEPFLIVAIVKEAVADVGIGALVFPIDGSASATVSITGFKGKFQKIDNGYIDLDSDVVVVDLYLTGHATSGGYESNYTPDEILEAIHSGKDVKIYFADNSEVDVRTVFTVESFSGNSASFISFETGSTEKLYIRYIRMKPNDQVPFTLYRAEVALVVK